MSVHYKFKSSKEKHTVIFDGMHITVIDLKKEIMNERKVGKTCGLDLQLTNQQTGEVYETDATLIPKNTTVDVARVPTHKKFWNRTENESLKTKTDCGSHIEMDIITKSSSLSTSYGTEDEKIKAMMSQSTQEYEPSKYIKNRGIIGPLPSSYTCYRCGQPGHHIKQCPTNNSDVKRSTGIPRSFMIPASAQQRGALLTSSGEYAVPIINHEAYKEVRKEKPPFMTNNDSKNEVVLPEIPNDLKCSLCEDLLQEAVLIPCCGNSYCDDCVRTFLLESESHQCPTCHEKDVSPDTLIPNRFLRLAVNKLKNDTGYQMFAFISVDNKMIETNESQSGANGPNVEIEDTVHTNDNDLCELKLESEIQSISDVTLDEVILEFPKNDFQKSDLVNTRSISGSKLQILEENVDKKTESQKAVDSNAPLVEKSLEYETNDEPLTHVNTIQSLANHTIKPFQRQQQMIIQGPIHQIRTTLGQQSMHNQMPRLPLLAPPQCLYHPRPQDPRFYCRPIIDKRSYPLGMGTVLPFSYTQHIRQYDPYGYMGPRSHMPTVPLHHTFSLHQGLAEAPPPGTAPLVSDNIYYSKPVYDDYEDRVDRFTRQLESRPTQSSRPRSRTSSRNRCDSSSSSTSCSTSSGFNSRSFCSSRSECYSPQKRSPSRGRNERRLRSKHSRHNSNSELRYHRSRSPHDYRPNSDHSRHFRENNRENDVYYYESRYKRYDHKNKESNSHNSSI